MLGIFKKFRNFVGSKFLIIKLFTLNVVFFTKLTLILFSIVFSAILIFSNRIHSRIDDFFSQRGFVISEILLTGNDLIPNKFITSKISREVYIYRKNDEICAKEHKKGCKRDGQKNSQQSLSAYKSSVFLNIRDLAHCVSSIPLISKVYVHRELPNRLYIKVEEYEVLARVMLFSSKSSRIESETDETAVSESDVSQMSNSMLSSIVMNEVSRHILSNIHYYLVLNNNTLVQMKNVDLSVKKFPIVFVSNENMNEFQEDISEFTIIVSHMKKIISEKLSAMGENSNYHMFFEFNDSDRYSILLIQKGSNSEIASDLMIDFANMIFSLNGEINANIKSEFYKIFKRKLSGFFVKLRRKNYESSMNVLRNFFDDYSMDSRNSLILVDLRMKNKILLRKW